MSREEHRCPDGGRAANLVRDVQRLLIDTGAVPGGDVTEQGWTAPDVAQARDRWAAEQDAAGEKQQ